MPRLPPFMKVTTCDSAWSFQCVCSAAPAPREVVPDEVDEDEDEVDEDEDNDDDAALPGNFVACH